MNKHVAEVLPEIVPFRLKDAPSLIERIFPSMKISAEAQKERKAGGGQTLTALGSYWKGRKPLILVRACVLGCLLPATDDPEKDLEIFETLMGIDDAAFLRRDSSIRTHEFARKTIEIGYLSLDELQEYFRIRSRENASLDEFKTRLSDGGLIWSCSPADVRRIKLAVYSALPYEKKVSSAKRPEEIGHVLHEGVWPRINRHLGTRAHSLEALVEQLGIMRFGRRPVVSDTFAGGGSIPFEAARVGCDVHASDLNPIACMLTWGALNIVGGDDGARDDFHRVQKRISNEVETYFKELGIEYDSKGNKAKSFLYCVEARCPDTGWLVPMLPSRVISTSRNVVVELIPDHDMCRYEFNVVAGVSNDEMKRAANGTLVDGRLVHPMNPNPDGVSISTLRGDFKDRDGTRRNRLRPWKKDDIVPRPDDIYQERLYCIQWITAETLDKARQETFFAAPTAEDLAREAKVESIVREHLADWQSKGLVPDMPIEPGDKTDEPIRTRGWTYWHHLFPPRHLLLMATIRREGMAFPAYVLTTARMLNLCSRLCLYNPTGGNVGRDPKIDHVFLNQAFNTLFNYGVRSSSYVLDSGMIEIDQDATVAGSGTVATHSASAVKHVSDIFITDPPYADAVNYHELTEFFIAWLRKNPPKPLDQWHWDSRRRLAIKGKGEEFRTSMVEAYKAMADHMPNNGIQIVMFTHQDGKVWSDMTQIFWGAGLQVMADWYIATETTSELKKGGYVQGTHIIVLRKRPEALSGYSDEITQEVREEVARQIEEMVGLNQTLLGHGRSENLFNDADLQMAGYAAALRVLTKYVRIDGKDMTVEALRPRTKNERTIVDEIIEYAVQVANEHLLPEGMDEQTWRRLSGAERFYLKMLDIESTGARKVDNYQNFAKAFRVANHGLLMASEKANDAALHTAAGFGKRLMGDDEFGSSLTRAVLYALWEMGTGVDDDLVMEHLRGLVDGYLERRADLQAIARYIAVKRHGTHRDEATHAEVLAGLIKNERLG